VVVLKKTGFEHMGVQIPSPANLFLKFIGETTLW